MHQYVLEVYAFGTRGRFDEFPGRGAPHSISWRPVDTHRLAAASIFSPPVVECIYIESVCIYLMYERV